jgi:hypothetical protein
MPFDFDLDDQSEDVLYDHSTPPARNYRGQSVDEVVQGFIEIEEEDIDEQLSDVEKRLEIAAHFRLLLRDHLFSEPVTEAGLVVEKMVRSFIKGKLKVLLGIEPPPPERHLPPPSDFSTEQVEALRLVADKVLASQGGSGATRPQKEALQPAVKKAHATPPPVGPTLKTREVRETGPQAPPRKTSTSRSAPIMDIADGPSIVKKGGKVYSREVSPETGKEYLKDITPSVPAQNKVSQPTAEHANMVMAQHASEVLRGIHASPLLGMALSKITITGE